MKKKSKLAAIALAVVLVAVSLGGGFAVGKGLNTLERIDFMPQIAEEILDEFDITIPGVEPVAPPDGYIDGNLVEIQPVPETKDDGLPTTTIYEKVNPSVVSITVYGSQSISAIGSGTGIVMTADGYIITNAHVVDRKSVV